MEKSWRVTRAVFRFFVAPLCMIAGLAGIGFGPYFIHESGDWIHLLIILKGILHVVLAVTFWRFPKYS